METVRAFAGRAAGSGSSSGSTSADSGSSTTSSPATSRPSASRIETLAALPARGARTSASSFAATGSRSERESRNSWTAWMMRETGVPVKIKQPQRGGSRADDARADRRHQPGQRVGREGSRESGSRGEHVVRLEDPRVPSEERDEPEHAEHEDREPDGHAHAILGGDVPQEDDPPIDADDGEGDGAHAERSAQEVGDAVPRRSGRVEPDREDRQQSRRPPVRCPPHPAPTARGSAGWGSGRVSALVLRGFFVAVRFLDDGEARRAGARRAVFWGTYTSMITGKMTGLRWVTS